MLREKPCNLSHIRNMQAVVENGIIIFSPVPAFYAKPQNISDIVDKTVGRALGLFGIDTGNIKQWGEL